MEVQAAAKTGSMILVPFPLNLACKRYDACYVKHLIVLSDLCLKVGIEHENHLPLSSFEDSALQVKTWCVGDSSFYIFLD